MIPPSFRKLSPSKKREALKAYLKLEENDIHSIANTCDLSDLADVLVESSIGTFPIPLGTATGFLIDHCEKVIPMATEEASVIAGASYAARIVKSGGGFTTWADEPVMTAQIFLKELPANGIDLIVAEKKTIGKLVNQSMPNMVKRGGGYRGLSVESVDHTTIVSIDIDVRDAMGANVINTAAEGVKNYLLSLCGGRILMAILTNASKKRMAGASFKVPAKYFQKGDFSGEDVCKRIVEAYEIAASYPERAITHNKGVMNGVTALALATGNDTRAVESAAHFYAQHTGRYQPLTRYAYEDQCLAGAIALPLALGSVGGAISYWPPSQIALKILQNPGSQELNRFAAALGLAQNLAALFALVTEGIQKGHMKLHSARLACESGNGEESLKTAAKSLRNKKKRHMETPVS